MAPGSGGVPYADSLRRYSTTALPTGAALSVQRWPQFMVARENQRSYDLRRGLSCVYPGRPGTDRASAPSCSLRDFDRGSLGFLVSESPLSYVGSLYGGPGVTETNVEAQNVDS